MHASRAQVRSHRGCNGEDFANVLGVGDYGLPAAVRMGG